VFISIAEEIYSNKRQHQQLWMGNVENKRSKKKINKILSFFCSPTMHKLLKGDRGRKKRANEKKTFETLKRK